MTDETTTTTLYVKSIPKRTAEDIGRCAKRQLPEPMTLAGYIEHVHGFYQARKNVSVDGPTIEQDGTTPAGSSSSSAADAMLAKAAFFNAMANVTEKVRGNSLLARHVRDVIIHQLGEFAPGVPLPEPPRAARKKALTLAGTATAEPEPS